VIGWISGTLKERFSDRVLVNTNGVGYEVLIPASIAATLGEIGSPVELFIHTHVREDEISLFGFTSLRDRRLFLHLTSVSGIGPKTALAIFSALPTDKIVGAIRSRNVALLQSVPGIGKKTAERIGVELADRMKDLLLPTDGSAPLPVTGSVAGDEVISALVNLGYKQPTAEAAFSRIDLSKFSTFDSILKETLRLLSK